MLTETLTTYKDLFDKYANGAGVGNDAEEYHQCTDEIFVQTPSGPVKINGVFQKVGKGLTITFEDGNVLQVEERHTVMTSAGWRFAKDAADIQHADGHFVSVTSTESSDETQFYDICIDYPHAYYDTNGFVHHNTYTIMQTVKAAGLVSGRDFIKMSGKATPASIYQTLFMFREGGLVIFDDLDSMWGNEDATNILKGALDTSDVREITWGSTTTVNVSKMSAEEREIFNQSVDDKLAENPEKVKLPNQFEFKGQVLFISNLKKSDFDSAIMSRAAKICMDMTPTEILKRMRQVLPTLGNSSVPLEKKEELLDHLISMHSNGELNTLTMREFVKGMLVIQSGAPNWKDLVAYLA